MHLSKVLKIILMILVIAVTLAGCQPGQHASSRESFGMWKYSDVRLLDPIDTLNPEQDLIALYTRINNQFFQIRMDFLNFDSPYARDIYVPIDTNPGGLDQIKTKNNGIINMDINWDYLIIIPASGKIEIINSAYSIVQGLELFVLLDPIQDKLVLSVNQNKLRGISSLTKLQVYITQPDQVIVIDQTEPISIDAPSPSRAKILFSFWNTFNSSTPAETLRSWAGAHSGPMSSRHGIKYLLEAAANNKYPIFITDLNNPETMSALDYLGAIPLIRNLENQNILYLADKDMNNSISDVYNVNDYIINSKIYMNEIENYGYANDHLINDGCMFLPAAWLDNIPISELLLKCKTLLISQGLSPSNYPIIFGGDFQASLLGDPSILNDFFSYINAHPWIQVLSIYDLQPYINNVASPQVHQTNYFMDINYIFQKQSINANSSNLLQIKQHIYSALMDSPDNQISTLAFQVYKYLSNPGSPELVTLGANYMGEVGYIIEAAKWVANPISLSTCGIDLDYDGENECILASNNIFLTIEPKGGYIPFIFSLDKYGAHQIVGPTWEFILGLSDSSTWDLSLGVMSDPGQILGAFVDNVVINEYYNVNLNNDEIIIEFDYMSMRKSYTIRANSILVRAQLSGSSMLTPQIPLVLDPWTINVTGWGDKYINTYTSESIQWEIKPDITVQLRSMNQMKIYPFNAGKAEMAFPEDPNFDYGRGHYLPFPMALVEIQPNEGYSVDIVINP